MFLFPKWADVILLQSIWLVGKLVYFVIIACIVKESFPVCAKIGLTWSIEAYVEVYTDNPIPDHEEEFLNWPVGVKAITLFQYLRQNN